VKTHRRRFVAQHAKQPFVTTTNAPKTDAPKIIGAGAVRVQRDGNDASGTSSTTVSPAFEVRGAVVDERGGKQQAATTALVQKLASATGADAHLALVADAASSALADVQRRSELSLTLRPRANHPAARSQRRQSRRTTATRWQYPRSASSAPASTGSSAKQARCTAA
jgi:hypothetical protein